MRCFKCNTEFDGGCCPSCRNEENIKSFKKGSLLGFRSNKVWKKILSICYLAFWGIMLIGYLITGKEGQMSTFDFLLKKFANVFLILIFMIRIN